VRAHFAYLKYVLRHKWFVFVGCRALGVPLHQAIIHDWVKFLPIEWFPYVRQFYNSDGSKRQVRDATGAYDPNKQADAFKRAWLHHQRQPHHWQAWISIGEGGNLSPQPMPQRFVLEMVADWYGAGMAISGTNDLEAWFLANKHKIVLEEGTFYRVTGAIQAAKRAGLIP
jgi:hypothetical protein